MAKAAWKFLMTTSLVASMSAITAASSFAASLTNPTVSGTAGTDYYLYKQVGSNTVRDDSASLSTVLEGSAASLVATSNCLPIAKRACTRIPLILSLLPISRQLPLRA